MYSLTPINDGLRFAAAVYEKPLVLLSDALQNLAKLGAGGHGRDHFGRGWRGAFDGNLRESINQFTYKYNRSPNIQASSTPPPDHDPASTAFIVISAFISFEIGQPVLAAFASLSNVALSTPGIRAETSR